jgi:hypothetical protein
MKLLRPRGSGGIWPTRASPLMGASFEGLARLRREEDQLLLVASQVQPRSIHGLLIIVSSYVHVLTF